MCSLEGPQHSGIWTSFGTPRDLFDEVDFYKKSEIDHKFMVTKFIPKVVKLFKEGVISEPETERGGSFIVATPGRVFRIQEDYSVS